MDLRTVLQILRSHWLSIGLITVIGGLLGFGFAAIQPREYSANATGIISTGASSDLGTALAGENLAKSRVLSYIDVAHSRAVAQLVIDDLGLSTTPEDLVGAVAADNPTDTALIQVSVTSDTPEGSAVLAEAWIQAVGQQIDILENPDTPQGAAPDSLSIVSFQTLESAVVPTEPSSPNTRLLIAVGLLLGLVAGLSQAFVRSILDRRVRRPSQVEEALGVPVVGNLPRYAGFEAESRLLSPDEGAAERSDEASAMAESLRELRTNLQFMNVDDPPQVVTITSSLPGEGKSTVAANLAQAIAENGETVILLDGDLRRPTVARSFGLPTGVGLTDVLIGQAELDDVLQQVGTGSLFVLGSGPIPPNPSELLGSRAMRDNLAELAERGLVLIDAPPLLPVTDAAVLSAVTDGAVIVGRWGKSTLDAAESALSAIERVSGTVLGFIINAVPLRGAGAYSETYRYKYQYGYGQAQGTEPHPVAAPTAVPVSSTAYPIRSDRPTRAAVATSAEPPRDKGIRQGQRSRQD